MDDLSSGISNLEHILDGIKRPCKLNLSVLSHITAEFSDDRKIGQGGCGHVYKGILPSGQIVAVKKLLNDLDDRMFQQEVTTMMSVKHQNIVRLLGYCSQTEQQVMPMKGKYILAEKRERLLCLDYMSNGSLGDYITDELRGLEWHKRFQIIKGILKGLHHLHKEKNIIHMDLKPPNILLDDDLVPKITDFGISRPGEISKTMSQRLLCSLGYCAPEYQFNGKISFKVDIYSLGVIIGEIVTGRREEPSIAAVLRRWRRRWINSAKHTTLRWQQDVTFCLELVQRCKNENPTERPNIWDIIREFDERDSFTGGSNITNATTSTVEKKNTFLEDMLGIEPLELHFSPELNKHISQSIQLTNGTNDYVAFRVQLEEGNLAFGVTRRLPLRMHPSKDVIPPRSSCNVTVTLGILKKPLQEEHCVVELSVKSTGVDKDLTAMDITADIFNEEAEKVVDTVSLMVRVRAPKQLMAVEPLELCYSPIEANKWLPRSLQLTNRTGHYVAFTFILPQGKVLYNIAMGMGIMPPWSTRGVVIDMLVKEEALAEMMQCKDTCLVRSVVVDKDFCDDDVSVDMFYELTHVQEMELDIAFAAPPQQQPRSHSSLHHAMYDDQQDSDDAKDTEDDERELTGEQTVLVCPFSIETELLRIYPAELRFASEEGAEYMSITNKTEYEVSYAISHYDDKTSFCILPPQSTRAVLVSSNKMKKPYQIGVTMIHGSAADWRLKEKKKGRKPPFGNRFLVPILLPINTIPDLTYGRYYIPDLSCGRYYYGSYKYDSYTHDDDDDDDDVGGSPKRYTYEERKEIMNEVRAEGGKAHEALLACIVAPTPHHPKDEVTLSMDTNGLGLLVCMDVHPTEPWFVTGHDDGRVCIWKMDPKTSACETMMSSPNSVYATWNHIVSFRRKKTVNRILVVKFIARMQWVLCGDWEGYITVYTYADNGLTEINKFPAEEGPVYALAVHPSLPYLLSSSKHNLIKLWDWDQGRRWMCTREFSFLGNELYNHMREINFNPMDANTFASIDSIGEIKIWKLFSPVPITRMRGDPIGGIACFTADYMGCLATLNSRKGRIEIFNVREKKPHVHHVFEATGLLEMGTIVCHPRRPLLATESSGSVFLWNYTTYRHEKVIRFDSGHQRIEDLGFIDTEGFQRLVIALDKKIQMVDISDGPTLHPWHNLSG